MFQSSQTHLPLENAPFLARLTAVAAGTGTQANLNLYSWKEQAFDPTTGFPVDANPGRSGNAAQAFATEINNALLTVPGATPPGYANAGPYVSMRLTGVVNGGPFYQFSNGQPPLAWIVPTSATSQTVNLSGGGSVTAFPTGAGGVGAPWFVPLNGLPPLVGQTYQCRPYGEDTSGNAVWASALPFPAISTNFVAPASSGNYVVPIDNTWHAVTNGPSVTLASAGVYLVFAQVSGEIKTTSSGGNVCLSAVMVDGSGNAIGQPAAMGGSGNTTPVYNGFCSCLLMAFVTVTTAPKSISLQVIVTSTDTSNTAVIQIAGDTHPFDSIFGLTAIGYTQITGTTAAIVPSGFSGTL